MKLKRSNKSRKIENEEELKTHVCFDKNRSRISLEIFNMAELNE